MLALRAEAPDWNSDGAHWPNRAFSRFVESDGIRFHVQIMGDDDAPVALLVHGTGAATHSWRAVIPALADKFRVVCLDLPGHGFTSGAWPSHLTLPAMARSLGALLKTLGVVPQVAIGHSAGAAILLEMQGQGALRGCAIVGLNAALEPIEGSHLLSPLAKLLFLNPMTSRLVSFKARLGGISNSLIRATGSNIDQTGIECYSMLLQHPAHVNGAIGMMARWDLGPLQDRLSAISARVLLIAAKDDPMVPYSVSRKAAHQIPNSRIHLENTGGHLLHEVEPEAIADLVSAFGSEPS